MKNREGVFLINPKKEINNNGGKNQRDTPIPTDPKYADSNYREPKNTNFKGIFHNNGNKVITNYTK